MSKKSIVLRARGFVDATPEGEQRFRYHLAIVLPVPVVLLATLWSEPTAASLWRGGICLVLGEALRWWSAGHLLGWQGALAKGQLVSKGPQALVRNPSHIGSFLVGLGLAVMSGSWPAYFVLFGFALLGIVRIIPREERSFGKQLGPAYEEYRRSVPGYVPGRRQLGDWFRAGRGRAEPEQAFRGGQAWLAERPMLIFLTCVVLAMIVRWRF